MDNAPFHTIRSSDVSGPEVFNQSKVGLTISYQKLTRMDNPNANMGYGTGMISNEKHP